MKKKPELDKAKEKITCERHEITNRSIDCGMEDLRTQIVQSILSYEPELVSKVTKKALEEGMCPMEIVDALSEGMRLVGEQFQKGDAFIFHLVISAEAMNTVMAILKPLIQKQESPRKRLGTFVMGTVEGDIHDIGKNIVTSMLQASGFEVLDLGTDVSTQRFVDAIREINADMVGASALLSTTKPKQKELVEALAREGLRSNVKIMIGGAAANKHWAKEIGADGYAQNAVEAVEVAKKLAGESGS